MWFIAIAFYGIFYWFNMPAKDALFATVKNIGQARPQFAFWHSTEFQMLSKFDIQISNICNDKNVRTNVWLFQYCWQQQLIWKISREREKKTVNKRYAAITLAFLHMSEQKMDVKKKFIM